MSLGKLKSHLASTIGRKQDKALDSGRIQQAEHRAQEKHKQFRLVRRHAKQREEDLCIMCKGITYTAVQTE